MEENIAAAEEVVNQWGLQVDASLFSDSGRADSKRFLRATADLHRSMLFFTSPSADPAARSASLLRAHSLLSAAMRRLESELHLLLSAHGQRLNPFDPLRPASNISDSMISAGYGVECVRVYKTMRKSFVDESVRRLGFERLTQSQIQKFEWDALESKIRDWLATAPVAFRALFTGERLLCDSVFAGSDSIRESCFADVTRDAAARFLAFPELVARSKRSPEKLFLILDLHNAVAELWPDIESMFRFESTAAIRKQAVNSLLRLTEVARSSLADFEAAIQRDASRSLITGGDVHPLTRYVMNYLVFLANYQQTLADIFADLAFEPPSPLPEPLSSSSSAAASGSISVRIAWLVLVLICKLDIKAELYREVALSYLFLANNIQFIVRKVKESKLRLLLGDLWVARHEAKARHHAASCERLAWSKVAATVPADNGGSCVSIKYYVIYNMKKNYT
uniref:Exocyst subunit Exo70 family protein n=1 Tax=Musa acuminata subsp. malaccensis TaxID=214687 RepID=A0A804KT63_MUSAM